MSIFLSIYLSNIHLFMSISLSIYPSIWLFYPSRIFKSVVLTHWVTHFTGTINNNPSLTKLSQTKPIKTTSQSQTKLYQNKPNKPVPKTKQNYNKLKPAPKKLSQFLKVKANQKISFSPSLYSLSPPPVLLSSV